MPSEYLFPDLIVLTHHEICCIFIVPRFHRSNSSVYFVVPKPTHASNCWLNQDLPIAGGEGERLVCANQGAFAPPLGFLLAL